MRTIHHRAQHFAAVEVDNGENYPPVFIESVIPGSDLCATRWCEVLGEPGVNLVRRAAYMVDLLSKGEDVLTGHIR